jgi:hypothetical protein
MKITNKDGRSWISKFDNIGTIIHITNAEVSEFDLKGKSIVIKVKK